MSGWDEWFRVAGDYLPPSGIAVYKNRRKAPHLLAFLLGEGGPRQRWIGCFRKQLTCAKTFFHLHHLSFMPPAPPTSALRAPPSKGRRDRYTRNAPHSRPFLWKGLSSEARRGWLPPVCWKYVSPYRYPYHLRASPFIKIDANLCINILANADSAIESAFP